MKELLAYLNSLPTTEQADFALRCGTSVGSLRTACSKGSRIGAELCVAIERESGGVVTRLHLRSADWAMVWPELEKQAA